MSSAYLFTNARASVHADHPEGQGLGELLTLFGDLQSQLSGWSHDDRCERGGTHRRLKECCKQDLRTISGV